MLAGVLALGSVAACGDDEGEVAVTQEEYDAEVERLCGQHGEVLSAAYSEVRPDSDAEEAAFYTSDLIPRARALIRRLADLGFPPDKDAQYRQGFNDALAVLSELGAEPYRYIDERHRQELTPEEDLMNRLRAAFASADVVCA